MVETVDLEVFIVNHSNRVLLNACVISLHESCADSNWRANVIDNASDDGSINMLREQFSDPGVLRNEAPK